MMKILYFASAFLRFFTLFFEGASAIDTDHIRGHGKVRGTVTNVVSPYMVQTIALCSRIFSKSSGILLQSLPISTLSAETKVGQGIDKVKSDEEKPI